jgi:glycerol-3-phosphate acyltransferase PlsY
MGIVIIGCIIAYLLGSIPFSVWIGKTFYGIDVREHGSGNAGATNTLRVLGKKTGFLVLFLDSLKGFLAANVVRVLDIDESMLLNYQMLFGMMAVLGHIYPIFAGFKGGKGIATLLGIVIAMSWKVSLVCMLCFVLIVWLTRFISVGSMLTCLLSPLFVFMIHGNEMVFIYFCIGIAVMVVYTHRSNLQRLMSGTENKFTFKPKTN